MQLFYNPNLNIEAKEFCFDKEESKHIVKVLRKKEGDLLNVTNGKGILFETEVMISNPNNCKVIITKTTHSNPLDYKLHLAVAPTKMNDRYEWFLEKATEIGIQEITPIIGEHSERKQINAERFEKIILVAMKQSNSLYLPKINPAISVKEFIKNEKIVSNKYIAHCEDSDKKSLKTELKPNQDYCILIGPEGDFSKSEIALAIEHHFIPVSLGNSRLRTETAAVVACHSVAFINEK
jgi:16S rRNA (uracil1498-N3)-methyltransferase